MARGSACGLQVSEQIAPLPDAYRSSPLRSIQKVIPKLLSYSRGIEGSPSTFIFASVFILSTSVGTSPLDETVSSQDYVPTVASEISKVFLDLSMKTVRRDYVGHSIMCNVKDVLLKVYFGYAPCWRDRLLQFLGSVCG
jgi:hypothetical protein